MEFDNHPRLTAIVKCGDEAVDCIASRVMP